MSKILIPIYGLSTPDTLTATPDADGEILASHELRCATDGDLFNFTYIWTGSDQPIEWDYSTFADTDKLEAAFGSNAVTAMYLRIENNAFDALSGDYNYAEYQHYTESTWIALSITGYGDGEADGATKWKMNGTVEGDGEFVIAYSDICATTDQRLNLKTENSNNGANYKVYDVMHGLLVDLPDNENEERTWSEDWTGGAVGSGPFGKNLWYGLKARGSRRGWTSIFAEMTETDKDIVFEVFKASRGCLPMLYMRDTSDKGTWVMCRPLKLRLREPQGGLWFAEVDFEAF